jgi:hypothetical protein
MSDSRRLVFLAFLWDTQHALFFSQPQSISAFELHISLPCGQSVWEASSAEEWWESARDDPEIYFATILEAYMTPRSIRSLRLDPLPQLLVLHGLMSMQWDLKRREQGTVGKRNAPTL